MHIHSLSWLKQLLAFCWREPFPLPPRSTLFMLSIYRKSATKQYILYTFLSIYIFSFCSVPFSIFMLPCVVGLVYAPSSFVFGLVFAVGHPPFPTSIPTLYLFAFHWRKGVADKPGQKRKFAMEINSYAPLAVKRGIGKKERKAT